MLNLLLHPRVCVSSYDIHGVRNAMSMFVERNTEFCEFRTLMMTIQTHTHTDVV